MTDQHDVQQPVIQMKNLSVRFPAPGGSITAVRNLSYTLSPGSISGILGESGSGKSVSSRSLADLAAGGTRQAESLRYRGKDLMNMQEDELGRIRGNEIAYIFQNPRESLNPYTSIGTQFRQLLRTSSRQSFSESFRQSFRHSSRGAGRAEEAREEQIHRALEEAGLPETERILQMFPHQLSGGQNQRVNIAMALLLRADVIIADEPTSAVDSHLRGQILSLLERINREHGTTILIITHDFAVIRRLCSRVLVMYGGLLVEDGPVEEIMSIPRHPYTRELLQCSASLESASESADGGKSTRQAGIFRRLRSAIALSIPCGPKGNRTGSTGDIQAFSHSNQPLSSAGPD
ncbi:ABC transporter ATP-binding protein [Salinispira pacifica]|uniref:Dipeptide transport ATP-binding protein DppD n=1 Tax=Salinispira pacifica TaxID=1307761 RepID=V5WKC4_9SPIO|nr:ABC transporter ATP-binding protein [Salinispira pacifica]AHC16277.1 Dipeptide transport ATP-binding protein DppD [Salinispira pacifica]